MSGRNLTSEEFWKLPLEERCERYKDLSDLDKFGVRQAESGAVSVPCNDCKYYYGYAKCAAYPDGISGEHMDAVSNDPITDCGNGYRFQARQE